MNEARTASAALRRLLPGWVLTAGLSAALCAGLLDLFLSLWLEPPAGLASGTTLLLVLAVTFALALAAFVAGFVLFRLVRAAPLPLALALAALLLLGLLLLGVARSLGDGAAPWRQSFLLGCLAISCAGLVYLAARAFPGLAGRRRLWSRISLAAPLLGGAALLALWLARYRLAGSPGLLPVLGAVIASVLILSPVSRVRSPQAAGRWLACLAVVALAGPWISAWAGSSGEPAAGTKGTKPKRIILLSIDTLRAGALSCYGEDGAQTPHLDRLAADAVRFTHAYSSASWTLPSMASVMTGLSPEIHRAVHSHSRVPDGVLTLAEALRRSGYRTAALVSSTILGPATNLTQGFDEYTSFPGPWIGHSFGAGILAALAEPFRPEEATPPDMAGLAAGWLRAHTQGDLFLWVHVFDPHAPYGPPREYLDGSQPPPGAKWRFEGWDEEAIRAGTYVPTAAQRDWIHRLYLGEVRYVDDAVGRLAAELQRLGMYDDALIVVLSDHGEEFWEHGAYGHGHSLYDELLHVPLLVKLPRSGERGVIDRPVTTASVMPTVLALSGLRLPESYPAASALPLGTGAADRPLFRPLFSLGLNRFEDRKAVRFCRFKYVRWDLTGREELYDLAADPGERHDIAPHEPQGLAAGRKLMAAFDEQSRDARRRLRLGDGEEAQLDDGTLARLRALGYVR
jgi:arylsulfatase A-like enzyme